METLRVAAQSKDSDVAGAIASILRKQGEVAVQAIGPDAVNQAVRAAALAYVYISDDGLDYCLVPHLSNQNIQGKNRTIVRLVIRIVSSKR